jgi:hypothetical protein
MQMGNPQMEHMPQHQSWGPPQGVPPSGGGGPGYGPNPQYLPPPRQLDNYYQPADLPPMDKQPHHGISAYGREAPMGYPPSNAQTAPSMVTQVTICFLSSFFVPFWVIDKRLLKRSGTENKWPDTFFISKKKYWWYDDL